MIDKLKINICEREFELPIEYDCYSDEEVTETQVKSIEEFSYDKNLSRVKSYVEEYCEKDLVLDKENKNKDNIFTYIHPHYIYVKREENPRIAIMCKYKYDMEHGLAIVFSKDGKIEVGLQDIIL